jgi:hypothetical protein
MANKKVSDFLKAFLIFAGIVLLLVLAKVIFKVA